jgi:hypothetical protein
MGITVFGLIATIVAAAVGFLLGTAAEYFASPKGQSESASWIGFKRLRDAATLDFAFVLAIYLMFISIFAADIFDPTQADLRQPRSRLEQELSKNKVPPGSLQQLSNSIPKDTITSIAALDQIADPTIATSLPQYMQSVKGQATHYVTMLAELPNNFGPRVEDETKFILQKFERENRNHFGVYQTEAHVDDLIQYFQSWRNSWFSAATRCRDALNSERFLLEQFVVKANQENKKPVGQSDFPKWPDSIHVTTIADGCNFDNILGSLSNSDLPPRKPDPRWGSIGPMVQWLLNTESRDVALLTGLLGFGLFGAVSAPFIRQRAAASGTVFIRGIAAAILIYMVVVGGLAVVTRESIPNPLAVYFACLIAAVYSDDVWKWAREHQRAWFSRQ